MAVKHTTAPAPHETSSPAAAPAPDGAPQTSTESKTGAKAKTGAEAEPNVELVSLFTEYDTNVSTAEQSYLKVVEFIQKNELPRPTVVASMMRARGITYETAQSQYSRMKGLLNDEATLADLREGKITLKVARERTTTKQKNPATAKPEAKEQKFTSTLKAFIGACKESGLPWSDIILSVEAERKTAGIK